MYKQYMLLVSMNWIEERPFFDTEEEMKDWIRNNKKRTIQLTRLLG